MSVKIDPGDRFRDWSEDDEGLKTGLVDRANDESEDWNILMSIRVKGYLSRKFFKFMVAMISEK